MGYFIKPARRHALTLGVATLKALATIRQNPKK